MNAAALAPSGRDAGGGRSALVKSVLDAPLEQPAAELARIQGPTLIPVGFAPLETLASRTALADRLRVLAGGRELTFRISLAAYPDFRPFAAASAYADGQYVATIADAWPDAGARRADLEALRGQLAPRP